MIEEKDMTNGEFFIAPVYNYLIRRGKLIKIVRPRFAHGLGTPKDLEKFLSLNTKYVPIGICFIIIGEIIILLLTANF